MPIVRVEMWDCKNEALKKKMAAEITKLMVDYISCPSQAVSILFTEIPKENWAIGGELCSELYKNV